MAAAGLGRAPARRAVPPVGWRALAVPAAFVVVASGLETAADFIALPQVADLLVSVTFLLVLARAGLALRDNDALVRASRAQARTDALTGLGNRRALHEDVAAALASTEPHTLALFDLDGFKAYNDAFGHAAGDALLRRLGAALDELVAGGRAYRLGGDEFCVLTRQVGPRAESVVAAAGRALTDAGEGFRVSASHGSAVLPAEAPDTSTALQLVDQRMYASKHSRRDGGARRESHAVLLGVLDERDPALDGGAGRVAAWALEVGRRLGLDGEALDEVFRAAQLHDIGKTAIPDVILGKPGPLNPDEWRFMRHHTLTGERIVARAAALRPVAALVRSSHEHVDGSGYPDGLVGEEIPLGSRIILVCAAAHALTSDRPYRPAQPLLAALTELRRCSGTQFDPAIVEAFAAVVLTPPAAPVPAAGRAARPAASY